MKRSFLAFGFAAMAAIAVGCGGGDLNKDLKPADKSAPKPTAAGAPEPGGKKNANTASKAETAPITPP